MGGNSGSGASDFDTLPQYVYSAWGNLVIEGHEYQFDAVRPHENPYHDSPYLSDTYLNLSTVSPYGYGEVFLHDDISDSFFGAGLLMTSYDSLYGTFKDFMTDVDVSALYDTIASNALTNAHISTDIAAESAYLDDEINQVSIPKLNAGLRDINSVMSTGLAYGKSILESQKLKMINKYSATMKTKSLDLATARWTKNLEWNSSLVSTYMQLNKLYWLSYYDNIDANVKMRVDHKLWPFTILDFQRSYIGAAAGAGASPGAQEVSRGTKAATGALAGASAMSSTGNPYMMLAGAIVGGAAGYYG